MARSTASQNAANCQREQILLYTRLRLRPAGSSVGNPFIWMLYLNRGKGPECLWISDENDRSASGKAHFVFNFVTGWFTRRQKYSVVQWCASGKNQSGRRDYRANPRIIRA